MVPYLEIWTSMPESAKVGEARLSSRRGRVCGTFSYDSAFQTNKGAYSIDPAFPLVSGAYHVNGLPGALRDSSPDRWGRMLIKKRHRYQAAAENKASRDLDEVDYLLGVYDQTRQGSLRFKDSPHGAFLSETAGVPPLKNLPELLNASRLVSSNEDAYQQVKLLLDAGSASLGGARPKASVADDGKLFLAKFPHKTDEWDVMAWEKTALDLAQQAKIKTPAAKLVKIGRDTVLLLERFDREKSLISGMRIPYISGMTLLQAADGDQCDYVDLAEDMTTFVGDPNHSLKELFKRIALSIAINNTDDHMRNHGFLRTHTQGWELSPLFDVNPNPSLQVSRATSIMGASDHDDAYALAECCEVFALGKEDAKDVVCQVLSAARTWQTTAKKNGISASEIALFAPVLEDRSHALRHAFGITL